MRILLIGAGYVGMHLLANWKENKDSFVVLTTTEEKKELLESLPRVEKVVFEIEEGLKFCEGVIVCVAPKDGRSYEETYLKTAYSLSCLIQKQKKPLYLLYTSSTSVYGNSIAGMKVGSKQHLSKQKILMKTEEVLLSCASQEVTVCILRLAGIYGPGRSLKERAERLSGKVWPGKGDRPTNHVHLYDVIGAIVFCFQDQLSGIFNIVSDAHPTRADLYGKLCEAQHLPPPLWNPHLPEVHGSNSSISNQKIKDEGYVFSFPELDLDI